MSLQLFKAFLSKDFYHKVEDSLPEDDVFPIELRGLYRTLIWMHQEYEGDFTVQELFDTYKSLHPTLTPSNRLAIEAACNQLKDEAEYNPTLAGDIILKSRSQLLIRDMLEELLAVERGEKDITSIQTMIEDYQDITNRLSTNKTGEDDAAYREKVVTLDDLEDLLQEGTTLHKWKFNLPMLQQATNGLPECCFGIVGARPDGGKTAFYLSLMCNDGGFLEQGANVAVWRNEERYDMVARRAMSSFIGVPFEEALLNIQLYKDKRSVTTGDMFILKDTITGDADIKDIDNYLQRHPEIDILIIDQLDNVSVDGKPASDDIMLLGQLYREARAIAIRRNVAIIAITQAGAEADGKLHYSLNGLYGSKTNKQAHTDFIFGIGSLNPPAGQSDDGLRSLNFLKNKLKGPHKPILYRLKHNLSRIEE